MTVNFLLEMEEKEYLIMRSVHTKIDDVTASEQNLNPNQIWISRQTPFSTLDPGATINDVIREEEEAESGIFCMSNVSVFHKSDHSASLSYWIGQLLSQKMIAGHDLLIKQLLNEAEFEERPSTTTSTIASPPPTTTTTASPPPTTAHSSNFFPASSSTPKIDKKRKRKHETIEPRESLRSGKLNSSQQILPLTGKEESVEGCTKSLLEVSRRLDGLLSHSRKMNAELKQVRQDLDCMEGNLDRVSENCKKTQSEFREMAETSENLLNHESEEVTRILELAFNDYSRCEEVLPGKMLTSSFDSLFQHNKTADSSSQKVAKQYLPTTEKTANLNPPKIRTRDCFKRFCSDYQFGQNSPKQHSSKDLSPREFTSKMCAVKDSDVFQSKLDLKLQNIQNPNFDDIEMTESASVDEFYQLIFDQNCDADQSCFDEKPKMDPLTTFTSLMDFDFFSSVRQPWRRIKDVDINFIV